MKGIDMVFYFSGTGNSEGVARIIAQHLSDTAISIVDLDPASYSFGAGDSVGFVFPVYAYAAPEIMIEFARHVNVGDAFCYAVCTFSNVTGDALEHFRDFVPIKSGYGIKMPDNYPVLDHIIDTRETTLAKLRAAKTRIAEVLPLLERREEGIFDTLRGENGHERSYRGYASSINPCAAHHPTGSRRICALAAGSALGSVPLTPSRCATAFPLGSMTPAACA